jgi:cardiolipin synthase (CMP-forming)
LLGKTAAATYVGSARGCIVNLPNTITIGRIILVPVVVWAIAAHEMRIAFVAFVIAGVSDAVDGFLAKRFNMATELGAYLDPIADKALLVSIYISLAIVGVLPMWLTILVVSRDIMIVGAVVLSWVVERPVEIRPLIVSKLNTTAQIVLAALVLASLGIPFEADTAIRIMAFVTGTLTVASAAAYLVEWMRHMAGHGTGEG